MDNLHVSKRMAKNKIFAVFYQLIKNKGLGFFFRLMDFEFYFKTSTINDSLTHYRCPYVVTSSRP